MSYFVYILFSPQSGKFYIGQTSDLPQRLERHNCGYVKSTSPYLPWILLLTIEKHTRSEAMILERKLKKLNRKRLVQFIEKYRSDQ